MRAPITWLALPKKVRLEEIQRIYDREALYRGLAVDYKKMELAEDARRYTFMADVEKGHAEALVAWEER